MALLSVPLIHWALPNTEASENSISTIQEAKWDPHIPSPSWVAALVCHSPLSTPGQPAHSSTTCSHEGILITLKVLRSTVRADHTYSKEGSSTRLSRQHIHKEPVVQYMQPRDRAIWYFWGLGSGKNSAKSAIQSLQNEVTVPFLNRKYFCGRMRCGRKGKSEKQFCPKLHKWQCLSETNKCVSFSWKSSKLLL